MRKVFSGVRPCLTDILDSFPYNRRKAVQGRGEYAGMDNCHARDQCTSDFAGHGKNCLVRERTDQGIRILGREESTKR